MSGRKAQTATALEGRVGSCLRGQGRGVEGMSLRGGGFLPFVKDTEDSAFRSSRREGRCPEEGTRGSPHVEEPSDPWPRGHLLNGWCCALQSGCMERSRRISRMPPWGPGWWDTTCPITTEFQAAGPLHIGPVPTLSGDTERREESEMGSLALRWEVRRG